MLIVAWMGAGAPWGSVPVADVPDTPAASLVVVILLADLDGKLALLAGVGCPPVALGVAVAGVPDQVCLFDAHRFRCG